MNIFCIFLVGVMLISGVQSVTAAQSLKMGHNVKKINLSKIERVGTPGVGKPLKKVVRFAQEDTVYDITPRQEKNRKKHGSTFLIVLFQKS